jgi:uncharacterized membrane protein HdeD (DUF308 family)
MLSGSDLKAINPACCWMPDKTLRDPAQGMLTITLVLIVFFMIDGISKVVFLLTIRPFPD